jgi:hypothetical protein
MRRLMSWPIKLSIRRKKITPPSRMGMGSRLKIPRFRLIACSELQKRRPAFLLAA